LTDDHLETLFLDAGGVLVHPNWGRVSEALAEAGVDVAAARLAAADPHAKRQMDDPDHVRSSTDESRGWEYFDLVLTHAGIQPTHRSDAVVLELHEYHARHNLWEVVPSEVVPALESFRALGLQLAVVSNSNGTLHDHLERLGLAVHFDHIFDSGKEGVEKPDPRFFQIALERSGAQEDRTMHVGDIYSIDVLGARSARIRATLLDAAGLYRDFDCARVASLTALADTMTRPASLGSS
jgi:HAD superfamily hydrolase (TIGR01509 family)